MIRPTRSTCLLITLLLATLIAEPIQGQRLTGLDRERGRLMLRQARADLQQHYYDTTYRGVDLAAHFSAASAQIDSARSNSDVFAAIAGFLAQLDDPHTLFIPPERATTIIRDWGMKPVGDKVYVTIVRPGTDAARQGLLPGDQLLRREGHTATRSNHFALQYRYDWLHPQPDEHLTVRHPDGRVQDMTIRSTIREGRRRYDLQNEDDRHALLLESQWTPSGSAVRSVDDVRVVDDVMVWRLSSFLLTSEEIDARMRAARRHRALVLDLRNNASQRTDELRRLAGHFFDEPMIVAIDRRRGGVDTLRAIPQEAVFQGRLIILVDARTGGSAEVLARLMQLNARATVVGDWTAGWTLVSRSLWHTVGTGRVVAYGVRITTADRRSADGQSLEGKGMMPDEEVLPTAADLAAGHDPVLARGIAIAGGAISPADAGALLAGDRSR